MNHIDQKAEEYADQKFPTPDRPILQTLNECYKTGAKCGYASGFRAALTEALPLIKEACWRFGDMDIETGTGELWATLKAFLEKYEGEL